MDDLLAGITAHTPIQHIHDRGPARLGVELERNSRGFRWTLRYEGEDPQEVLALLREVNRQLQAEYGGGE